MIDVLFYFLAAVTILGALSVAFSKNIVHSAFGLMASMLGIAGFYGYMSADFLMVTQLVVYVGGIIILVLFAVMFTGEIRDIHNSNKQINLLWSLPFIAALSGMIIAAEGKVHFLTKMTSLHGKSTVTSIGNSLLTKYLLPFEVVSLLLFAVLLGAVYVARKHKSDLR